MQKASVLNGLENVSPAHLNIICDRNCYKCILPCKNRDKPVNYVNLME